MSEFTAVLPTTSHASRRLHKLYKVIGKLGEGGSSKVYDAIEKQTGRHVAIKVTEKHGPHAHQVDWLRKEAAILQSLRHPNIVQGYDFIEEENHICFVLEKINGGELFDRILAKKKYTEREARDLSKVLLEALKYLHAHRIAHKDLKPENLLMASENDDANVKIVDFGLAEHCEGFSCSHRCGTIAYCAPEVIKNRLHGTPVDMWSFGVILFILLGGYPPFHEKNGDITRDICEGNYSFHPSRFANVSNEAKDLVCGLLNTSPLERLTAAEALAHPWMSMDEQHLCISDLDDALADLRHFQAAKKLKAGIFAVAAAVHLRHLASGSRSLLRGCSDGELPHTLNARYEVGEVTEKEDEFSQLCSGKSKLDGKSVTIRLVQRGNMNLAAARLIRNEVAMLQSINHPHILDCHDFFEEPNLFYIVLEPVTNVTLVEHIASKDIYTEIDCQNFMLKLLGAADYFHGYNLVHSDLRPENLLMGNSEDGSSLKICSFHFAALAPGVSLTSKTGVVGYAAPEILARSSYGTKADIFSLGVILFILLSGEHPFEDAESICISVDKNKQCNYNFSSPAWKEVTMEAKHLVEQMLQPDPKLRLSAQQALSHQWFQPQSKKNDKLAISLINMKQFVKKYLLHRGVQHVRQQTTSKFVRKENNTECATITAAIDCDESEYPSDVGSSYLITRKLLGRGGFGEVREAFDRATNLPVAMKIVNRSKITERDQQDILYEVEILRTLDHPHIVTLHNFYEQPDYFYLVMEKIDGGELFDRIVSTHFYNESYARDMVFKIADGIQYLHHKHIVHRDLKPENLLMTNNDAYADVKIVDFGFASPVEGMSLSRCCGTIPYIAPEILQRRLYGLPVDCWSFGCIIYVMLCGTLPFHDNDEKKLEQLIVEGNVKFDSSNWNFVSSEAKDLIRGLLEVNPLRRLTIDHVLTHPWLHRDGADLQQRLLTDAHKDLRAWQARRKFRKGINAVIAARRWHKLGVKRTSEDIEATDEEVLPAEVTLSIDSEDNHTDSMIESPSKKVS